MYKSIGTGALHSEVRDRLAIQADERFNLILKMGSLTGCTYCSASSSYRRYSIAK
jgi:hypothetical protein